METTKPKIGDKVAVRNRYDHCVVEELLFSSVKVKHRDGTKDWYAYEDVRLVSQATPFPYKVGDKVQVKGRVGPSSVTRLDPGTSLELKLDHSDGSYSWHRLSEVTSWLTLFKVGEHLKLEGFSPTYYSVVAQDGKLTTIVAAGPAYKQPLTLENEILALYATLVPPEPPKYQWKVGDRVRYTLPSGPYFGYYGTVLELLPDNSGAVVKFNDFPGEPLRAGKFLDDILELVPPLHPGQTVFYPKPAVQGVKGIVQGFSSVTGLYQIDFGLSTLQLYPELVTTVK